MATWVAPSSDPRPEYTTARQHDELERIKGQITEAEYQAGLTLRRLWQAGTLNPQPAVSCVAAIGWPPGGGDGISDDRLEANDELRRAVRSMGMLGMTGRLCIEVICYDRMVRTDEELRWVRDGLSRLAGRS